MQFITTSTELKFNLIQSNAHFQNSVKDTNISPQKKEKNTGDKMHKYNFTKLTNYAFK